MSLTLYISSNCKSPTICDFEFFLRVRSQSQVFVVFPGSLSKAAGFGSLGRACRQGNVMKGRFTFRWMASKIEE